MDMKLVNSCVAPNPFEVRGIGLANVRKRLDLLYKDAYTLKIIPDEDIYTISMQISL